MLSPAARRSRARRPCCASPISRWIWCADTVRRGGQTIDLQPREFRLLEFLMRNQGRIVTRTMLLERVWDFHFDPKTSVVETHISRLRAKIDRPFANDLIHTTRGAGYSIHNGG